jgi:hypothetical protein
MKRFVVVAVLVAAACGGDKAEVRGNAGSTPEWLSQGSGTVVAESGKKLQAIGSSTATDPKARRQQADMAARAKLDAQLTQLATTLAKMSESNMDNLADVVAGLTKKAAASAQIRDHYVGGDGNEMSLEVLDLSAFKSTIATVDGDDRLKKEIAGNADKAFDQLVAK